MCFHCYHQYVKVSLTGYSYLPYLNTFTNDHNHLELISQLKLRFQLAWERCKYCPTFFIILIFSRFWQPTLSCLLWTGWQWPRRWHSSHCYPCLRHCRINNVKLVIFGEVLPQTKAYNIDIDYYGYTVSEYNECMGHYLINHEVTRRHPAFQHIYRHAIWFWHNLRLH